MSKKQLDVKKETDHLRGSSSVIIALIAIASLLFTKKFITNTGDAEKIMSSSAQCLVQYQGCLKNAIRIEDKPFEEAQKDNVLTFVFYAVSMVILLVLIHTGIEIAVQNAFSSGVAKAKSMYSVSDDDERGERVIIEEQKER